MAPTPADETVGEAFLYQPTPETEPLKVRVIAREVRDEARHAYIHYEGLDRRLDEWVLEAKLVARSAVDSPHAAASAVGAGAGAGANGAALDDVAGAAAGSNHKRRKMSTATTSSTGGNGATHPFDEQSAAASPSHHTHHHHHHHHSNGGNGNGASDDSRERQIWHHGAGHDGNLVRNIRHIQLGPYRIDCWYYSPYPPPYDKDVDTLYVCEHTLKYFKSPASYRAHAASLKPEQRRAPPGDEIYRDDVRGVSVFRIEGKRERLFCQNLCLLGKLFIEHKTLHFDPAPFFFFLLTERVPGGGDNGAVLHRPVGYFSKEVDSPDLYNLACILTLPPYQRKGYGRFIISLSYEISKREGKLGSPEKPLSDLGKLSYRAYWSCVVLTLLRDACRSGARPSVRDLASQTGVKVEDIVSTLQALGLVKRLKGSYVLAVEPTHVDALLQPFLDKDFAKDFCRPECLRSDLVGNPVKSVVVHHHHHGHHGHAHHHGHHAHHHGGHHHGSGANHNHHHNNNPSAPASSAGPASGSASAPAAS